MKPIRLLVAGILSPATIQVVFANPSIIFFADAAGRTLNFVRIAVKVKVVIAFPSIYQIVDCNLKVQWTLERKLVRP